MISWKNKNEFMETLKSMEIEEILALKIFIDEEINERIKAKGLEY